MAITFQNQDYDLKLKQKADLKIWIETIIQKEKKKRGNINFVFTNDEELLDINQKFLDHSTYTDIITFDNCENGIINGDIIISVDRVKENASKFKVPFETELRRVMIHGVLHLLGYKDKTSADKAKMRSMEDRALKQFPKS
jgi:rRNA maturation RNase YbeY